MQLKWFKMADFTWLEDTIRDPDTTLTVGTFDGVHAGHRVLVNTVINLARKQGGRSVIVTFDPHPREIINPGSAGIKLLSSLKERGELLSDMGVDEMIVIPFDRDFSLLTSEQFVRNVVWNKIGVSHFVIGYDHHFGRDRTGTISTVTRMGNELGYSSHVVSRQEVGDTTVSSTAIRKAIQDDGDMERAASFLERFYILNGNVVHGAKRGKKLGFATANLQPDNPSKVIPKDGVYAVWVRVGQHHYQGMMNIGSKPTFEGSNITLEVHIIDFNEDIYGIDIQIQFVKRIRDEQKFDSAEALVQQIQKDREEIIKLLKKSSPDIAKQSK